MLKSIYPELVRFKSSFSNNRTFMWFCASVVGFCAGADDIGGVSSITRNLGMRDKGYEGLIRFFRSTGVNLLELQRVWLDAAMNYLFAKYIVKIQGGRCLF
jgi:hypothetical protein